MNGANAAGRSVTPGSRQRRRPSSSLARKRGFLGLCHFMNSDAMVLDRLFRFVLGIKAVTLLSTRIDEWTISLPGLFMARPRVVGMVQKPLRAGAA